MSEYTKGPWEWVGSDHYGYSALWNPETRQEVLVTGGINDGDDPITWMGEELTDGDKGLIAAAPEILEELENANALIAILRSFLGPDNDYYALINEHMAKSAPLVAKAKGE